MSADVNTLQSSLFDSISNQLGLKATDFTEVYDTKKWQKGAYSGSCEWFDESKGSKLTGVAKYSFSGSDTHSTTINCWMGPGFMVPHMMLTVSSNSVTGKASIVADYIPRGPSPIGSDSTYTERYFSSGEVLSWYDSAMQVPGAVQGQISPSFSGRLLRSPVHLSITGIDMSDASNIASQHVTRWLKWLNEATQVESRQRGAINVRDDKLRQYAYRASVTDASALVGNEFGKTLGASWTGPVSEAYVGGGS